jgi:DNA repair exonuclease SbcCD ATPase subunit
MSIIHLEELKLKNFLSYGSTLSTFKINSGLTLISGQNKDTSRSNGAGKSGLNESIVWSLFGKTIKDISKDQILNWKNKKKCYVEISFTIDEIKYRVERGIKPNILKIFKDDVEIEQMASVVDFQKYLEDEILKIDYKTFVSLFYYNPNNFVSIFDIPKAQKRKFLENIFNLEAYSDIKNKINKKVSSIDNTVLENKTAMSKNEERISSLESNISKYNNDIISIDISTNTLNRLNKELLEIPDDAPSNDDISNLEENIANVRNLVEKINISLSENRSEIKSNPYTNDAEDKLKECETKLGGITQDKDLENLLYQESLEFKIKKDSLNNDLRKVSQKGEYEDLDNCPICGSKMDNESLRKHKAQEKERIQKELSELTSKEKDIIEKYNNIKQQNLDFTYYSSEIERLSNAVEINKKFTELMKSKEKLTNTYDTYKSSLDAKELQLKEMRELVSKSNKEPLLALIKAESEKIEERKIQIQKLEEYKGNAIAEVTLLKSENVELNKKNTNISLLKDYYSFLKRLCGDDQIKQYAISSLVPIINQRANHYLSEAAVGFYIKLDGWLDCEIKGAGISNATANSLSGGEKKSLELALQFALYDISKLKCKNLPNILILDEILDSSVDVKGIENLMNIVKVKQTEDDLACLIISHRKEVSSFTFDNRMTIVKSNGYSSIKEEN